MDVENLVISLAERDMVHNLITENDVATCVLKKLALLRIRISIFVSDNGNKKGNKNLAEYIC